MHEDICGETAPVAYYDVKYVLGGTEKQVRETYISCTTSDGQPARRPAKTRDFFTPELPQVWRIYCMQLEPHEGVLCNDLFPRPIGARSAEAQLSKFSGALSCLDYLNRRLAFRCICCHLPGNCCHGSQ